MRGIVYRVRGNIMLAAKDFIYFKQVKTATFSFAGNHLSYCKSFRHVATNSMPEIDTGMLSSFVLPHIVMFA